MNTLSSLLTFIGNRINEVDKFEPVGSIKMFAGSAMPSQWLKCDGSAVSRITYAELFAVIGTTYGEGNGSTTFNLPNFSGRTAIGVGSSETTGASSHELGSSGGSETHTHTTAGHTLTVNEMPSHTHNYGNATTASPTGGSIGYPTILQGSGYAFPGTTATGGGASHSHGNTGSTSQMNPYITVNFIIFAGK